MQQQHQKPLENTHMLNKSFSIISLIIGVGTGINVMAADFSVETNRTTASRGFGKIDHMTVSGSKKITKNTNLQGRLETKTQSATATSGKKSGKFIEGIASYQLTPEFYGMTRIGFTDEKTLFVDRSIYQEFGYKYGKIGPAFTDLNIGLGTRKFPAGTESFLNIGPTLSWASGALWLRREQSLDNGGFRHVLSISQWASEKVKFDASLISERRKKYTLPVAGSGLASDVAVERYLLGVTYKMTEATDLAVKIEKISLEKSGVAGKYYDPTSFGIGLNVKY